MLSRCRPSGALFSGDTLFLHRCHPYGTQEESSYHSPVEVPTAPTTRSCQLLYRCCRYEVLFFGNACIYKDAPNTGHPQNLRNPCNPRNPRFRQETRVFPVKFLIRIKPRLQEDKTDFIFQAWVDPAVGVGSQTHRYGASSA